MGSAPITFIRIITIVFLGSWLVDCWAQSFDKSNPFHFKGYINTLFEAYGANKPESRYDPVNFRLNSAFTIHAYGWRTSVNFNYSDGRKVYGIRFPETRIPSYALFGVSPSYKWAAFHLGFRSMHFSEYSMAGHSFYGLGTELSPGNFRISAFYGRLRRVSNENIALRQSLDPAYKRMGWGVKVGLESGKDQVALSLFSAHDINDTMADPSVITSITPQENIVIGITGTKKLGKIIGVDIDYAFSALNRDKSADRISSQEVAPNGLYTMLGLFNPRLQSEYNKALKTKLTFTTVSGVIHLVHERVDPGYRSLGSLFFNNDFENITGGGSFNFPAKKIMLSVNAGFQRNNLSGDETNSYSRFIGAIDAGYNFGGSSIKLSYSNFRTTNTLYASTIPVLQVDSVTLSLVNQQLSLSFLNSSRDNKDAVFNAMISYYKANAIENDSILAFQTNTNLMGNLSYMRRWNNNQWGITGGIIFNQNQNSFNTILTTSPYLAVSRSLMKNNLVVKGHFSLANIHLDQKIHRRILQPRINISYMISPVHFLEIIGFMTHRVNYGFSEGNFSEVTSRVSWKSRF